MEMIILNSYPPKLRIDLDESDLDRLINYIESASMNDKNDNKLFEFYVDLCRERKTMMNV